MNGEGGEKKEVRRPMNAFLIFCKKNRGSVRQEYPELDNRNVTKFLGDLWAKLGDDKNIYINLAKQHKDAFMKANPNYKWQNTEKSQGSCSKRTVKPTNARIIKSLTESPMDGSITPGKLADLKMMGGLNLLLMAEKEACERRSSLISSSASLPLASVKRISARTGTVEQPAMTNSALLQLAEMCTSELQGSTRDQQIHQSVSPLKKRVCHWSLPETADSVFDPSVASCRSDSGLTIGSLSSKNLSLLKLRSTSMEFSSCIDDKYASVEKYKLASMGRKLSTSTTDSVPSPSIAISDEAEDAELPMFSPELDKSGNRVLSTKSNHRSPEEFEVSHCSVILGCNSAFISDLTTQKPPLTLGQQPAHQKSPALEHQKSLQSHDQAEKPLQLHRSPSGTLRPLFLREKDMMQASDYQASNLPHHSLHAPLNSVHSSEHADQHLDTSEKKNSPYFQNWREPGKSKEVHEITSPGSQMASNYSPSSSSPLLKLNLTSEKELGCKHPQSSLTRFEYANENKPITTLPVNEKSTSCAASSVSYAKTTFASLLSEERIASLLTDSDASSHKFSLGVSGIPRDTQRIFHKTNNESRSFNKSNLSDSELGFSRSGEQTYPALKLTSLDEITGELNQSQAGKGSPVSRLAFFSQAPTFSEGKLKKKWTERMLVEAKLEQNMSQDQEKASQENVRASLNVSLKSFLDTGHSSIPKQDHRPDFSTFRNLIDSTTLSIEQCPKTEELKNFRKSDTASISTMQATSHFSQPLWPLDHTHSQSSFNASNHPKLMLQLSQNQQLYKPEDQRLQTLPSDAKIKSEPMVSDWPSPHLDHLFNFGLKHNLDNHSKIRVANNNSSHRDHGAMSLDTVDKNVLDQIAACGKKFMDHIVERFYKTDFSDDQQLIKTERSGRSDQSSVSNSVKSENGQEFKTVVAGLKKETVDGAVRNEDKMDYSVMAASSLVEKVIRKVCGSPPRKDGCSLYRKVDLANTDNSYRKFKDEVEEPISSSRQAGACVPNESSGKEETCRQQVFNHPNEKDTHYQLSTTAIESSDHRDIIDDTSIQPVRKSRRANRGQKYQELIKEGVIQPSRERLAARNAVRLVKNIGTREDSDKVDARRILKSPVSERDTPAESPAITGNCAGSSVSACSVDKKFTSGHFDPETFPACSFEQLDKRKTRRHCDSENLVVASHHRTNTDITTTLSRTFLGSCYAKLSPSGGSLEDNAGPACPTPHIPLPKKDQPMEPVVGSRKRKARKHCITRISVVDEAPTAKRVSRKLSSSFSVPQKKECNQSDNVSAISVSGSCSNTVETVSAAETSETITRVNPTDDKSPASSTQNSIPLGISRNGLSAVPITGDLIVASDKPSDSSCYPSSSSSLNNSIGSEPHIITISDLPGSKRHSRPLSTSITSALLSTTSFPQNHHQNNSEAIDIPEMSSKAYQAKAALEALGHLAPYPASKPETRPKKLAKLLTHDKDNR